MGTGLQPRTPPAPALPAGTILATALPSSVSNATIAGHQWYWHSDIQQGPKLAVATEERTRNIVNNRLKCCRNGFRHVQQKKSENMNHEEANADTIPSTLLHVSSKARLHTLINTDGVDHPLSYPMAARLFACIDCRKSLINRIDVPKVSNSGPGSRRGEREELLLSYTTSTTTPASSWRWCRSERHPASCIIDSLPAWHATPSDMLPPHPSGFPFLLAHAKQK